MYFEEINIVFKKCKPDLLKYIFQNIKDKDMAEDFLQDVFLKVVENFSEGKEIENLESYIFIMVRNKIIDYWRKAATDKYAKQLFWEKIKSESVIQAPDDLNIDKKLLVENINKSLSSQQRTIFELHCHNGLTLAEISNQLGLSKSTVKQHMILARKKVGLIMMRYTLTILAIVYLTIVSAFK